MFEIRQYISDLIRLCDKTVLLSFSIKIILNKLVKGRKVPYLWVFCAKVKMRKYKYLNFDFLLYLLPIYTRMFIYVIANIMKGKNYFLLYK